MKSTILVPVLNEKGNLQTLLPALKALAKKARIIFVDNGSTDGSLEILEIAKWANLLHEAQKGFAEPLNLGLQNVQTPYVIFLDADTVPQKGWLENMEKSLEQYDLVVGETVSKVSDAKSKYGKISLLLFKGFSERTAKAITHALPWGPTCNLGVRMSVFKEIGDFSPSAQGAFDIDWCWRAVLAGKEISWQKAALVHHWRRVGKEELQKQFIRYGKSEAWMQKAFSFLSDEDKLNPYDSALAAFRRLRHHPVAGKKAALSNELEELAHAFSIGVWEGNQGWNKVCPRKRSLPTKAIGWSSGKNQVTVFVPGRGLTEFKGKWIELWKLWKEEASFSEIKNWIKKSEKLDSHSTQHFFEEWSEALTPTHVVANKI